MKRRKLQITAMALMCAMLMGGCGEKAYALTKNEEDLIVNYSAHVVTKYNTYQKEGLAYVWPEDMENTSEDMQSETAQTDVTEQTATDGSIEGDNSGEAVVSTEQTYAPNTATLTDLFGGEGIQVDFIGVRLASTYVQDAAYVLTPEAGKQYLVVGIDVTNTGAADTQIDYLSDESKFQLILNDEEKSYSEMTLLTGDFSTFEAILKAGETRETVLLFQIPATVTTVQSVDLVVEGEQSYQIIL